MLVYCGATRTERSYIDGLKKLNRHSGTSVVVRGIGIAPLRVVQAAAAYRDRKPGAFDEVWCVVDVDQFAIDEAASEARRKRRGFCRDCTAVTRRLKKHVPGYDKTELAFADFAPGVNDAVKRAKDLDATGIEHSRNPSTSVWQLVERILEGR